MNSLISSMLGVSLLVGELATTIPKAEDPFGWISRTLRKQSVTLSGERPGRWWVLFEEEASLYGVRGLSFAGRSPTHMSRYVRACFASRYASSKISLMPVANIEAGPANTRSIITCR